MPKVKWIDTRDLHGSDICDCPIGNKKQVLTLDQLEAWLKHEQDTHIATARYGAFAYLLAQVQAWKAGK